jgi:hypothetical protein
MPDPANLPIELFDQILTASLHIKAYTCYQRGCDFHVGIDVRRFSQLLRVTRRWHNIVGARLYSKQSYNGARKTYVSLWNFLRTVLANPQLAERVQALNIGNWGFYLDVLQPDKAAARDNVEFSQDDLGLMRKAIHTVFHGSASLDTVESRILDPQSPANRDCRPLIVLLLICLPNLSCERIMCSAPFCRRCGIVRRAVTRCLVCATWLIFICWQRFLLRRPTIPIQ